MKKITSYCEFIDDWFLWTFIVYIQTCFMTCRNEKSWILTFILLNKYLLFLKFVEKISASKSLEMKNFDEVTRRVIEWEKIKILEFFSCYSFFKLTIPDKSTMYIILYWINGWHCTCEGFRVSSELLVLNPLFNSHKWFILVNWGFFKFKIVALRCVSKKMIPRVENHCNNFIIYYLLFSIWLWALCATGCT